MNSQTDRLESGVRMEPNTLQQEPKGLKWFSKFNDMRPQTASLIAGTTVMMYSGMHLAWGIFNWNIGDQLWAKQQSINTLVMSICSWFVAAIFGLIISAFMVKKLSKIVLYVS